jgi:hypothetical protein
MRRVRAFEISGVGLESRGSTAEDDGAMGLMEFGFKECMNVKERRPSETYMHERQRSSCAEDEPERKERGGRREKAGIWKK